MNTAAPPDASLDSSKLTEDQKDAILQVASQLIIHFAHGRQPNQAILQPLGDLVSQRVFGLFTTLKRGTQLRGCCGSLGQLQPLGEALVNACYRTTIDDVRMPAISPSELEYLTLDVSLLGELETIEAEGDAREQAFQIGEHGLRIQRGNQGGLLLPSVSIEQGWNAREFLEGVCRKATLPSDAWRDSNVLLQRFPGVAFHKQLTSKELANWPRKRTPLLQRGHLERLKQAVAQNLIAMMRGATPTYILPEIPDGNVQGIILSLFESPSQTPLLHIIQLSMRPGVPLQSSLFELTRGAMKALENIKNRPIFRSRSV